MKIKYFNRYGKGRKWTYRQWTCCGHTGHGDGACCFPAGTMVRMADEELKPIEDIKIGDKVMGYDVKAQGITSETVLATGHPTSGIKPTEETKRTYGHHLFCSCEDCLNNQ